MQLIYTLSKKTVNLVNSIKLASHSRALIDRKKNKLKRNQSPMLIYTYFTCIYV